MWGWNGPCCRCLDEGDMDVAVEMESGVLVRQCNRTVGC